MIESKGISIIYYKLLMRKTDVLKTSIFFSFKNLSLGQFLESSNSRRYDWILKLLVAIWKSRDLVPNYEWLFYYFNFERNYDVLNSKSPCIFWTKIYTLIKPKRNQKWEISRTVSERRTLCFNSYKNRKLKVKLWRVGTRKRNRTFLYRLLCPKEISLTLRFVSMYSVLNTISEYT